MRATRAGGLKCKTFSTANQLVDALDHEPTGGKRASFRIKGRQSACNLVGVYKFSDA
jgi:hypothetical protein